MPEKRIFPQFDSKSGVNNVYGPFFLFVVIIKRTIEVIYIKMIALFILIRNISEM